MGRVRSGFFDYQPKKPVGGKLGKSGATYPQEERVTRKLSRLKARQQPGSGSLPGRKGDVDVPQPEALLAECKMTEARELRVSMAWLRKITREARAVRKTPVLVMGFEAMGPGTPKDWAAVPLEALEKLVVAARWGMEDKNDD